jgi:hypothetical protein
MWIRTCDFYDVNWIHVVKYLWFHDVNWIHATMWLRTCGFMM